MRRQQRQRRALRRRRPLHEHQGRSTRHAPRIAAIILSPQYSPYIMGGYLRAVDAARSKLPEGTEVMVAGAWHLHPKFLRALAGRVEEALANFPPEVRDNVPVILTSHS